MASSVMPTFSEMTYRSLSKKFLLPSAITLFVIFSCNLATAQTDQLLIANQKKGKGLVISVTKGNCIACHSVPTESDIVSLANIGPPFVNLKARFPNRADLEKKIWDPTFTNPNTIMPPFGKHKILTMIEIHQIIDYLYSL